MNQVNFFSSFIVFIGFMLLAQEVSAQCEQIFISSGTPMCDDNETPATTTDDVFFVWVSLTNNGNPTGTWSSTDPTFSSGDYVNEPVLFGPYPITGGNVSVTITDDLTSCSEILTFVAPSPCSVVPPMCPDFDVCFTLIDQGPCDATYEVVVVGDFGSSINIRDLSFRVRTIGGTITSFDFSNSSVPLSLAGVTISGTTVSGGSGIEANDFPDSPIYLTVSGEVGECITPYLDGGISLWIGSTPCLSNSTSTVCEAAEEFCALGTPVSGTITAPGNIYKCNNTENNGIEGVKVTITGPNNQSCTTYTENDGTYECSFCGEGPYNICASSECPEPCGLSAYDLVLLRQYILGTVVSTKDISIIGDVNGVNGVTTTDLVFFNRAILGYNDNFNWCRFVSVADYSAAPNVGINSDLNDNLGTDNCVSTDNLLQTNDFLRFMVGDIDGSCSDCVHGDKMGGVGIVMDNSDLNKLKVRSGITDKIYAFTLEIEVPRGNVVTRINSMLPSLEYKINENNIQIIWMDLTENNVGFDIAKSDVLVEIEYLGDVPMTLSNKENYLLGNQSEIVTLYEIQKDKIKNVDVRSINVGHLTSFEVTQSTMPTQITLSDLAGRQLMKVYATVVGDTYVPFDPQVEAGIYILTVQQDGYTQSKKVFIQNKK